MARLPILSRRRPPTKAQAARATAGRALKTVAGWKVAKTATTAAGKAGAAAGKAGGRRIAPIAAGAAGAGAAAFALLRRRRRKQEEGLSLFEPPPAPANAVSSPPDPETRRPKESPGMEPDAGAPSDAPAGTANPPLGPQPS